MSYDVIRHADTKRREVIKFMKVIPGAVYFKSVNGNLQVVSSFRDSLDSEHANGRDIYNHLRKDTVGHGYKITTDELLKAARAYIDQFSSVKHSDDDPDVLTEDEIEIIDAPYPKDPQMPRGNAAMRPFDYEDTGVYPRDYTEGSLQHSEELWHHGILGQKWGVRRYQNADGSLTAAGRKRYGVEGSSVSSISDRKGMQNRLNDLDKGIVRNRSQYAHKTVESMRYREKADKTKSLDKHFKYEDKAIRANIEAQEYAKRMEEGKKETERILQDAVKQGLTVKEITTVRSTDNNKTAALKIIGDLGMISVGVLAGVPIIPILGPTTTTGTKYKVGETKEGHQAQVIKDGRKPAARSIDEAVSRGIAENKERQQQNQSKGMYVMAKPGELPESTRVTGKEEEEFWKALAKQYEEEEKKKK